MAGPQATDVGNVSPPPKGVIREFWKAAHHGAWMVRAAESGIAADDDPSLSWLAGLYRQYVGYWRSHFEDQHDRAMTNLHTPRGWVPFLSAWPVATFDPDPWWRQRAARAVEICREKERRVAERLNRGER